MLILPEAFAKTISAWQGEPGRAWLEGLPALYERLCAEWELAPEGVVMHGAQGIVVPVRSSNEPCVLKIGWLSDATKDEERALRAWNGRGAVKVLRSQPEVGAMLIERLDWNRSLESVPIREAVEIASALLCRLAIEPLPGIRTSQGIARELAEKLKPRWDACGRPMPRELVERACELAAELGKTTGNVLVNNDLHYGDVLQGTREPWLAVDPMVVNGDLEFSIPQLLWWRLEDVEANGGVREHLATIIDVAQLDPEITHAWMITRCVDYWLWGLQAGLTIDPVRCERIIAALGNR